jgi:hypothetical protein
MYSKLTRREVNRLCTGSDCLDTVLQLRRPCVVRTPDGLQGVT